MSNLSSTSSSLSAARSGEFDRECERDADDAALFFFFFFDFFDFSDFSDFSFSTQQVTES
jgi:hypothetical protein